MIQNKKLLQWMLFGYGGSMLLLVAMLTGLMILDSNVIYQGTLLVDAWDICISVVDAVAFALSVVTLIYGIYLVGARALTAVYAAYLCITVFHYVSVLCIGWLIFPGTLPNTPWELAMDFFEEVIVFVFLDCLRLFIIGLVTSKALVKREEALKAYNRKANILSEEQQSARSIAFPLTKFISIQNPVQRGAVAACIVYWLTYYMQYVYYDVVTWIKLDYFEGASLQIFTIAVDAVLAAVCYCIITFILMKLDERNPKQN